MADLAPFVTVPLGDRAVYVEFSKTLDLDVNAAVQRLGAMVQARALPWISDVVPALGGLAIHFDPDNPAVHGDAPAFASKVVHECLEEGLATADTAVRK